MEQLEAIHNTIKQNNKIHELLSENLFYELEKVGVKNYENLNIHFTQNDCLKYISNRINNGYIREKSVVNDGLANEFPTIKFEESPAELDHSGDIDYLGFVKEGIAFGIQIKPITAQANFGNYKPSERMQHSFKSFTNDYKGNVYIVFSLDGEIANKQVISDINAEINRLRNLK